MENTKDDLSFSFAECVIRGIITLTIRVVAFFIIFKVLLYALAPYLQHIGVYEYLQDISFGDFAVAFVLVDTVFDIILPDSWN